METMETGIWLVVELYTLQQGGNLLRGWAMNLAIGCCNHCCPACSVGRTQPQAIKSHLFGSSPSTIRRSPSLQNQPIWLLILSWMDLFHVYISIYFCQTLVHALQSNIQWSLISNWMDGMEIDSSMTSCFKNDQITDDMVVSINKGTHSNHQQHWSS